MTEENYRYRTSQTLLRNQFPGKGKWEIPIIPKFKAESGDFENLLLIGFDKTNLEDRNHLDRMVHFFLYDYRFERVWKNPDSDIEKLSRYRAVLSPDFSMYLEMAPIMQLYNVFRNRWCGSYWASKGIRVVPTVNWGDESTFDFCFEGIEKGSVVAVSTYMASEHDNRQDQKDWFMAGYNELLRRIEPETVICYNTPFPEMQGNIIPVDYELSSWKYMCYERVAEKENLESYKIGGTFEKNYDTISPYMDIPARKGGGSAYGGKWRPNPNKPEDSRYIGEPGEIITIYKNGYRVDTKIGLDGRAERERHYTDHRRPAKHSDPHDHIILWNETTGSPMPQGPINYPDKVPEFKSNRSYRMKNRIISPNTPEQDRFQTISEFKYCISNGGEVEFIWKGIFYGVVRYGTDNKITVYEAYKPESEKVCETPDDALEYIVGGDRLRDVITKVTVLFRSI